MAREISGILKNYGLTSEFIEPFGNVFKVYTKKGVFALKKIPATQGIDFVRHIQQLFQQGYYRIVPVYPTFDGRYGVWSHQSLYYLMPWIDQEENEERDNQYEKLFRELARLHQLTVKAIPIEQKERTEFYEGVKAEWGKQEEFLEQWISLCERETYMPPFFLLSSLYYMDILQALRYAKRKLDQWYESSKDEEKARTVLIHGKISMDHYFIDERGNGFFSNFENAKLGSPIHDLLPFFSRMLKSYPKPVDEYVQWYTTYTRYFPLKEEENQLFLSYLTHPGKIIRTLESYLNSNRKKEIRYVNKLQNEYWQLKNIEHLVMQFEEIEKAKNNENHEASS
ncbi:spore coat protein YsxE [Oikeobacillus pervagus]|uniref:Spore coat protein YsxE n=1 Tax=Oikeobacillus pervagus TaxID=1325931 RepID=A0AAJ1T0M7_9BACI|nr:spore coat protein YsxE [Oikeobacillus pervagus]MDQ0216469.1 spore coat protein YsxE [Oikeobacillus pervagus]